MKIIFSAVWLFYLTCHSIDLNDRKEFTGKEIAQINQPGVPIIVSYFNKLRSEFRPATIIKYEGKNYLVTNYYIITTGDFLVNYKGETYKPEVLKVNDLDGIAVLTFPGIEKFKGKEIASKETGDGQDIIVLGYPGNIENPDNAKLTSSDGIIIKNKLIMDLGIQGKRNYIQISNSIDSGYSGGPVFSVANEIIGIAVSKWEKEKPVSLVIAGSVIFEEIKSITDLKIINEKIANEGLKRRIDSLAISVKEMNVIEFGYHYSPTVKIQAYPYAKKSAEKILDIVQAAAKDFSDDKKTRQEYIVKNLSELDYAFYLVMNNYFRYNKNASFDTILANQFLTSQLYLAGRFFTILISLANLSFNDIQFVNYKPKKIKFNQDKTEANVEADIVLSRKTFSILLKFKREWGVWFLVPSY